MILLVHANDANDAMWIMGEHASAPQQGTKNKHSSGLGTLDFPDRMRMILAGVQIKIECLFGTTDVCFFVGPCPSPM